MSLVFDFFHSSSSSSEEEEEIEVSEKGHMMFLEALSLDESGGAVSTRPGPTNGGGGGDGARKPTSCGVGLAYSGHAG